MKRSKATPRVALGVCSLFVMLAATVGMPASALEPSQQEDPELEIVEREFAFTEMNQEQTEATYTWSVEMANHETQAHEVVVALELLDAEEEVVHADQVTVEIEAEGVETVEGEGVIPVESARTVVAYRNSLSLP